MDTCELEDDNRDKLRASSFVFFICSIFGFCISLVLLYFSEFTSIYFEYAIFMILGILSGALGIFNSYRSHRDAIILQIICTLTFIFLFALRSAVALVQSLRYAMLHYKNNFSGLIIPFNLMLSYILYMGTSSITVYYLIKIRKTLKTFVAFEDDRLDT